MQHLDVGDQVRLEHTFFNLAGVGTDATVVLTLTKPDATTTTPAAVSDGSGAYHYDLTVTVAGLWLVTWAATGAVVATETYELLVGMSEPAQAGPCDAWCDWDLVDKQTTVDLSALSVETRESIMDFATAILYGETGGRYPGICRGTFGLCDCATGCAPGAIGPWTWEAYPYAWAGCAWRRCTGAGDHLDLGDLGYPVHAVTGVYVAGVAVATTAYRVDEHRFLVRTDGQSWPTCPDLIDPANFKATIYYGRLPFAGGDVAAAALAAEMAKFELQGQCAIPEGVTDVMRQGITYRMRDAKDLLDDGLSGIPKTDRWLVAERSWRKNAPATVFDPAIDPIPERLGTDRGLDR